MKKPFVGNCVFFRPQENQVIHGKCGGYCGTCVPEHHNGLKLDLLPPQPSPSQPP